MKNIIGIVGSTYSKSTNRLLLQFIQKRYSNGEQVQIELVPLDKLPLFDKPADRKIPAVAQTISDKIEAADGVIIATPEYDHSVPARLSNALAWLSYVTHPFIDKPVMITGASYGSLGSSRAQAHLKQILDSPELGALTMPSSEFLLARSLQAFNEDGAITDQATLDYLDRVFANFMIFMDIAAQLKYTVVKDKEKVQSFSWDNI